MEKAVIILMCFLFCCCNDKNEDELMEIPVDIEQNTSLSLSEIAEEITGVELELTDESLIIPNQINNVLIGEDYIIIGERKKVLLFDLDGKFICSIGAVGQGAGEFTFIKYLVLDKKNKLLYINEYKKIICYNLDGTFINQRSFDPHNGMNLISMNYVNDELLILGESHDSDQKGSFNHSAIYRMNDGFQIADSCDIRDVYFERVGVYNHPYIDFITCGNSNISIYYSDLYFDMQNPAEVVQRDTLYRFKENNLIPELRLKFKDDGISNGSKYIGIFNIYRSSRYVFAKYFNMLDNNIYQFCYDTKTGKGYNMEKGYTDDINPIEDKILIRPLITDTDVFYYWYTHIKPDDLDEANPTLYIGKLKK